MCCDCPRRQHVCPISHVPAQDHVTVKNILITTQHINVISNTKFCCKTQLKFLLNWTIKVMLKNDTYRILWIIKGTIRLGKETSKYMFLLKSWRFLVLNKRIRACLACTAPCVLLSFLYYHTWSCIPVSPALGDGGRWVSRTGPP